MAELKNAFESSADAVRRGELGGAPNDGNSGGAETVTAERDQALARAESAEWDLISLLLNRAFAAQWLESWLLWFKDPHWLMQRRSELSLANTD